MDVREATTADGDAIRSLVERSMLASYSLGPGTIEAAVGDWFGEEAIATKCEDPDRAVLVAEREGDPRGVVDAAYVPETDTGDLLWLHVDPDYRGEGIGGALYDAGTEWLEDQGAEDLRGLVLANNADGNAFYREQGFERVGEREVDIDGEPFTEHIYHDQGGERLRMVDDEGREVYVDRQSASKGSLGPFFQVFSDADRTDAYGFQCGHCEALATAMDSMGRVECSDCGNTRKPTRWDAAYL